MLHSSFLSSLYLHFLVLQRPHRRQYYLLSKHPSSKSLKSNCLQFCTSWWVLEYHNFLMKLNIVTINYEFQLNVMEETKLLYINERPSLAFQEISFQSSNSFMQQFRNKYLRVHWHHLTWMLTLEQSSGDAKRAAALSFAAATSTRDFLPVVTCRSNMRRYIRLDRGLHMEFRLTSTANTRFFQCNQCRNHFSDHSRSLPSSIF